MSPALCVCMQETHGPGWHFLYWLNKPNVGLLMPGRGPGVDQLSTAVMAGRASAAGGMCSPPALCGVRLLLDLNAGKLYPLVKCALKWLSDPKIFS